MERMVQLKANEIGTAPQLTTMPLIRVEHGEIVLRGPSKREFVYDAETGIALRPAFAFGWHIPKQQLILLKRGKSSGQHKPSCSGRTRKGDTHGKARRSFEA